MQNDQSIHRNRELRVGLVGAGKMAQHHAVAIAASRGPGRIVAVADPSPEARASIREVAPLASEFNCLEEALSEVTLDIVHVCTPPATHVEVALEAIEAGCHVYVEKPFASVEADARRILDEAAKRGVAVCPGHQLLFERPARESWELLRALGDLQHVESYFAFRPVRGRGDQAPIGDEAQLLDILPHPVYSLFEAFDSAGCRGRTNFLSLEVGDGTVHALLQRGTLTGSLVVTLTARPVESYLRIVGTNGSLHADFVRGIVLHHIGPGSSGIDKLLAPYRTARQLVFGTTISMARRVVGRNRSYPGLREIFEAFYAHVLGEGPPPVSEASILETVRVQERLAAALFSRPSENDASMDTTVNGEGDVVLVTGGTGFLGRAVVKELVRHGRQVRVLARRLPAKWRQLSRAEYVSGDLSAGFKAEWLDGVSTVVHCAAATSGGWSAHQAASIDATENLLNGMMEADCRRLVHVSSVAVVDEPDGKIRESSSYVPDPRASGPYVWGKLESERLVRRRDAETLLDVTVVRPGAIVDYGEFDPPGRLGKRIGGLFVAVGGRREEMGVVGLRFCAEAIVQLAEDDDAPSVVHLLDPDLPSRKQLVEQLRHRNPRLRVVWLPRWTVRPLGLLAFGVQKMLRRKGPAINLDMIFGNRRYDNQLARDRYTSVSAGSASADRISPS